MEMQSLILISLSWSGARDGDGFVTKIVPDCRGIQARLVGFRNGIGGGLGARVGMGNFCGVWFFQEFGMDVKFH